MLADPQNILIDPRFLLPVELAAFTAAAVASNTGLWSMKEPSRRISVALVVQSTNLEGRFTCPDLLASSTWKGDAAGMSVGIRRTPEHSKADRGKRLQNALQVLHPRKLCVPGMQDPASSAFLEFRL